MNLADFKYLDNSYIILFMSICVSLIKDRKLL
jgi:hypothetical protein